MSTLRFLVHCLLLSILLTVVSPAWAWWPTQDEFSSVILNYVKEKDSRPSLSKEEKNLRYKQLHRIYFPIGSHEPLELRPSPDAELAPCQTLEIRVVSQTANGMVFKEGVGTIFDVAADKEKKFLLTVAHLVGDQKAIVGVCNDKYYSLKLLAVDTAIDTAVLVIDDDHNDSDNDNGIMPLFTYQKDVSPQILEFEKLTEDRNITDIGPSAIETLNSEFLNLNKNGIFYLQTAIDYDKQDFLPLLRFNRRALFDSSRNIVAEKSNLFPGSEWIYRLKVNGVKPGMSGSPIFFYRKSGERLYFDEYNPNVIMLGLVSKTKLNSPESALIPFNVIYRNLEILLQGISKTDLSISNDTLAVDGKTYRSLGAIDYKNSADEIPIPKELPKELTKTLPKEMPKNLKDLLDQNSKTDADDKTKLPPRILFENLLKNPQRLQKLKDIYLEKKGGDWGDGNGSLIKSSVPQQFYSPDNGLYSLYIDPTPHAASGVIDDKGIQYYGLRKNGQFYVLKSVYSLAPFMKEDVANLLMQGGIRDKKEAFRQLCQNPKWAASQKKRREEIKAYGTPWADSTGHMYSWGSDDFLSASCSWWNKIKFFTNHEKVQASLKIDEDTVSGEMTVLGCRTKIDIKSDNIWERFISNENFDAKIEIGDGEDFLLKFYFFKIKKICVPEDDKAWVKANVLSTITIK